MPSFHAGWGLAQEELTVLSGWCVWNLLVKYKVWGSEYMILVMGVRLRLWSEQHDKGTK